MDDREKTAEETHLKKMVNLVKKGKKELQEKLSAVGQENLSRLNDLRSDPETGTDFEMFLEQLHDKNQAFNFKDKFQRLEEMEYLSNNPYFARIDLTDPKSNGMDSIYISKFGYSTSKPLVTDWRSPIASVYYRYRYPQKGVEFNTVTGAQKRDLLLKRTFDIYAGQLIKYFNNDIQFDESDIVVGKIRQRTGGVLEDIVETIQKDQMDIIEADPREISIVQGCVGSGKSTVAIHKLAHIFFNYPGYIRSHKSILVAKSQILVSYLSTLFPKLGIFDINYKTLRDLLINVIFREAMPIAVDLDQEQDTSRYTLETIKETYAGLDSLHEMYEGKIKEVFAAPDLESYGGYKYSKELTAYENLNEIFDDLSEELESQVGGLKENPGSMRALVFRENIKNIKRATRKINDLKYNLKHASLPDILDSYGINTAEKLTYTQTLFYVFVYSKVIGFSKFQPYEYCVVDEAQDFGALEYAVLGQFVLRNRFGLFGDLNQQMTVSGIHGWEQIDKLLPSAKSVKMYKLTTNYRSTAPIIKYANKILSPFVSEYLPNSINRKGSDPLELVCANNKVLVDTLKSHLAEDFRVFDKSIGIVCFGHKLFTEIDKEIAALNDVNHRVVSLSQSNAINYLPRAVYIMSVEDCKGLEFSKVYVLGCDPKKINNIEEAKKFFVAVTRAMNELTIMSCN